MIFVPTDKCFTPRACAQGNDPYQVLLGAHIYRCTQNVQCVSVSVSDKCITAVCTAKSPRLTGVSVCVHI